MKNFLIVALVFLSLPIAAQETQDKQDTTLRSEMLEEVVVSAFNYDRPWLKTPAPIGQVSAKDIFHFNEASFVSAMNTITGVRMEERSPGSYRFSIRGSSLRSPFGIRNVKVYLNGLPFTDPGGNTYLNLLDVNSIQSAEVVKGPGSSMYGAGTGGALLLQGAGKEFGVNKISTAATVGSFGYQHYLLQADVGEENSQTMIQYVHQQNDGYRDQSGMQRDVLYGSFNALIGTNQRLTTTLLYSDLYYQTPGGLTKLQRQENPQQARPPAGPIPGATEQQAAVDNKTFYMGLSHEYNWNDKLKSITGVYGTFSDFENPSIRNYEKRTEHSLGLRSVTDYNFTKGKLTAGFEYQSGYSPIQTYANDQGVPNGLITNDKINSQTYSVFVQADFFLPHKFYLTAGGSVNGNTVDFENLSVSPSIKNTRTFDPVFSPRIVLQKEFTSNLVSYFSFSQGFSPPTVAELYPSTSEFNQTLQPEIGLNYELGIKSYFADKKISVELNGYIFNLSETIVVRRDQTGADYFINAGETNQRGIEMTLRWTPELKQGSFLSSLNLWGGYSLNNYEYKNFQQGNEDFSGNEIPGIAPNTILVGLNVDASFGLYCNLTFQYTDTMWLNDANTEAADSYTLLGLRFGYKNKRPLKIPFEVFFGADNLLDQQYSLGNDLNAFGGRYFNPAATRNFYTGLKFSLVATKND